MKLIKLSQGKFAQVDDEDYEHLNQFNWFIQHTKSCYAVRNMWVKGVGNKVIKMHRIIMNTSKEMQVDHIDHNGLNNQKSNLRNCTKRQNAMNRIPYGKSKYLGVSNHTINRKYFAKKKNEYIIYTHNHWISKIKHDGKYIHLGLFEIEEEAAKSYDEAAKLYHGEFANLNFK